ncbi:MAG: Rrf2 family transcriptional regulator [Candidatus Sumerlaeota bacterium]|nr:Rrf2 family transcriptional regulator [Candidatus Sumerlaeota bacterium]
MLSKTGTHAVRAMAALAQLPEGEYIGAAEIAQLIGAPRNYLGKLLQTLARAGLVDSQRGLGGGFRLARDPKDITLLDVIDPIEHVDRWSGCIFGNEVCSDSAPCALHQRFGAVRERYLQFLSETTLAELAGGKEAAIPL